MAWSLIETWASLDNWTNIGVAGSVAVSGNEAHFSCVHGSQASLIPTGIELPTATSDTRGWCFQTDFYVPSGGYSWLDFVAFNQNSTDVNDFAPTWGVLKFRNYNTADINSVDTALQYDTWYTLRAYAVLNASSQWCAYLDIVGVAGATSTYEYGQVFADGNMTPRLKFDTYGTDRVFRVRNTKIVTVTSKTAADAWIAGGSFPKPVCTTPKFSIPAIAAGYASGSAVRVYTDDPDTAILVTTDGSVPVAPTPVSEADMLPYGASEQITLTAPHTIKAVAFALGSDPSPVVSGSYYVKLSPPVPTPVGGSYPEPTTVSVTNPDATATTTFTTDTTDPADGATMLYGYYNDVRDGGSYRCMKLPDGKWWFASNLAFNTSGSRVYNDDSFNAYAYGRLYTYAQALASVPDGCHLPTLEEYQALYASAGSSALKLKATYGWTRTNANGTDDFGFSLLPAGAYHIGSGYIWLGLRSVIRMKDAADIGTGVFTVDMTAAQSDVGDTNDVGFSTFNSDDSFAVRCIVDDVTKITVQPYTQVYSAPLQFNQAQSPITLKLKSVPSASAYSAGYRDSDVVTDIYTVTVPARKLFVGHNGTWHEVTDVSTGHNGTWHQAQLSAGLSGTWH